MESKIYNKQLIGCKVVYNLEILIIIFFLFFIFVFEYRYLMLQNF